MGHYEHLSMDERETAMVLRSQGLSNRAIARLLKRSASTITQEFARNLKGNGEYSAASAQKQYSKRRKRCCRKRIMADPTVAEYVIERLNRRWTPEQIAGRAALEEFQVAFSFVTFYRAIDQRVLPNSLKKQMRFKLWPTRRSTGSSITPIGSSCAAHPDAPEPS